MEPRSSGTTTAGSIAIVGGLLALIGSFLSWANVSAGRFSVSIKGIDHLEGKVTIAGGILLLIGGITVFTKVSSDPLKVLGLFGGAVIAGVGIYTAFTVKGRVIDRGASVIAKRLGLTLEQARTAVNQAVDSGAAKITLDIGLYIVMAGGLLGIVAGLLALRAKPSAPAMPAAGGGMGLTGWAAPLPQPTPSPTPAAGDESAPAPTGSAPSPWDTPNPMPGPPSPPPAPPSAPPEPPPSDPGAGQAPT